MTFSDLPETYKPFVLAILMLDDDYRPDLDIQFRAELVLPVHEAFAAHLLALMVADKYPDASATVASQHLAVVERSGLLDAAWGAYGWMKAHGETLKAIAAACKPPAAPLH